MWSTFTAGENGSVDADAFARLSAQLKYVDGDYREVRTMAFDHARGIIRAAICDHNHLELVINRTNAQRDRLQRIVEQPRAIVRADRDCQLLISG
jgi:hypothetical protein